MSIENPHLLTQSQFVEQCIAGETRPRAILDLTNNAKRDHFKAVSKAVKKRLPVPDAVLATYPDLKAVTR
jgi:hypothetical protein